jgi:hypothetical protein
MVYSSQNLPGFWTQYSAQNSKKLENTTFRKLNVSPSSGEGMETPTVLGLLVRENLIQWIE